MSHADSNLRICTAFRECPIDGCRHKAPHREAERGMMRFDICRDSGILSACAPVVDGKVELVSFEPRLRVTSVAESEIVTVPVVEVRDV